MKSNIKGIFIFVLLIGILLLSACSKNGSASSAANANSSNPQQSAPQGSSASNTNRPRQQNRAGLFGEIKSINGNDVTVALLEMPQGGQRPQGQPGQSGQQRQPSQGGQQENQNNSGTNAQNNGSGANRGFSIQKNYTGETQTITISSDTPITSFGRGNRNQGSGNTQGNPQEQQLKLTDLKVGTLIQVFYKDENKKEIQSIRVMQLPN